ncbi:cyclin-dependent protein kinase inhibitor SMR1-like [Malania oleifera]|uniref:cyclin-dependent protein kinase inhibitor SMR1-like n=1 Tax=Malania oleifera TaxID=397392 RepID=UPI0025AE7A95|nr:cyclin-dependent protein kinase inhibitor SMR1-like [Malania oleifera]
MSMDLQLQLELPTRRPPLIRVRMPDSSDTTGDAGCPVDNNRRSADSDATGDNGCVIESNLQTAEDSDESSCRTPTSEEHKIPAILSCPPAPRKQKAVLSCKRRMSWEPEFRQIVPAEELEDFFRSSFEAVAGAKRRCTCI